MIEECGYYVKIIDFQYFCVAYFNSIIKSYLNMYLSKVSAFCCLNNLINNNRYNSISVQHEHSLNNHLDNRINKRVGNRNILNIFHKTPMCLKFNERDKQIHR